MVIRVATPSNHVFSRMALDHRGIAGRCRAHCGSDGSHDSSAKMEDAAGRIKEHRGCDLRRRLAYGRYDVHHLTMRRSELRRLSRAGWRTALRSTFEMTSTHPLRATRALA